MTKKFKLDVVTLDIIMHAVDGIDALAAIKAILAFDEKANIVMASAMGQMSWWWARNTGTQFAVAINPFLSIRELAQARSKSRFEMLNRVMSLYFGPFQRPLESSA